MAHERLFYAMGQGHSFVHWLDETVVGWANPEETDVAGRAHHTWALHSLHAALAITIVYLLFVYAALSIKADEEAASPRGSASPKSKPKPKSVVEKFRSGPALFGSFLQLLGQLLPCLRRRLRQLALLAGHHLVRHLPLCVQAGLLVQVVALLLLLCRELADPLSAGEVR